MDTETITFYRRVNRDGTIDLICSKCWRTVTTAKTEKELTAAELAHECEIPLFTIK